MLPIFKRIDPEGDVQRLSVYTKLRGFAAVAALPSVKPGVGRVTVDGVPLTGWETVTVRGIPLVFVPVGEVALEHGKRHRVVMEGFETAKGRRFPRCAFRVQTEARRERRPEYDAHDRAALEAAREGMVLLRNENGALPLASGETLNCFGVGQHRWHGSSAGASAINPRWRPGVHRAIAEHSGFALNEELAEFYKDPRAGLPDEAMLRRARAESDAALVFIERASGEMIDNKPVEGEYYLTDGELATLRAVRERFRRVIVILNTGYPIGMAWMKEIDVDAVLYAGFAGMLSSYALMELLDGRTNPSGHLADTWPWDWRDNPVSRNFPTAGKNAAYVHEDAVGVRVYYEEDVYLGYRWFDTFGVPVAFPFGHGLSYTTFALRPVGLERNEDGVSVAVRVRNTGGAAGKAVAQLYVALPGGKLEKPARVLADFGKTDVLEPGGEAELRLTARDRDIASFDESRGAWVLEAGEYGLDVGQSIDDRVRCGSVALEERVLKRVGRFGAPVEPIRRLTRERPEADGRQSRIVALGEQIAVAVERGQPLRQSATDTSPYTGEAFGDGGPLPSQLRRDTFPRGQGMGGRHNGGCTGEPHRPSATSPLRWEGLERTAGKAFGWREVEEAPEKLDGFVAGLSLWELCRLAVCGGMRLLPWQDGAAGYTHPIRRRGLKSFTVSDANAGLNLRKPNVGFPASSVIAATFNREIARGEGAVLAEECREHGVDLLLGPGMNLHRSILCGRHPEYFSEDPLLAGEMAGWQGRGLESGGVGCCYKHLFCNNAELGRKGSHSVVSEQALRELYFRAFEIAFRVQKPSAVMTSYNALNGLYPGENPALLQGLLRGEWGFEGAIMSDWGSYDTVDAVEMLKAGNDWITPGGLTWAWRIWKAAWRGALPRAALEDDVKGLLRGFGRL